jgi:DNA replication protein DnaC
VRRLPPAVDRARPLQRHVATLAKPSLLIIDELGYLPFEPNAAHLFFQLVSPRYERGSLLITPNPLGRRVGRGLR